MLSSKKLKALQPYINIVDSHKGKRLYEIFEELKSGKHGHFKKGASGLIIENLLGLQNNNSKYADLKNLGVEIKVLPIQLKGLKAKEPTQIKMINYVKVAKEIWENAEIRDKVVTIFWIAYGVEKINKKYVSQDKYIILDWFIDYARQRKSKSFSK